MTEQNIARRRVFQQLVSNPHRDLQPAVTAFREAMSDDPDFVARASVYINKPESGQKIRDTQDVACITLLQSNFPEYREAGRCTILGSDAYPSSGMPGLPPYRIFRIQNFVANSDRKAPRQMKGLMHDYFAMLESDPLRQDGVAIRNRKAMKQAWRHFHFKPSDFPRGHALLFGDPPEDSKLAVLKQIANSNNQREQAELAIQNRIPMPILTSVLGKMTPVVGATLINAMSPTEAANSRSWVERYGLLEIPEVRDMYLAKVAQARNVASMSHRASSKGSDVEVESVIAEAKEKAVKEGRRIERDTLILVDRSGSMDRAILAAQQFGSRIAPLCDAELMVVAFNDRAQEIKVAGDSLQAWETAFRGIRASGTTSIGAGLQLANRQGFVPEQVVILTDTIENRRPYLADEVDRMLEDPSFVFLVFQPGGSRNSGVIRQLNNKGYQVDAFDVGEGDYYIFDQASALLGGPPATSLVDLILSTELPSRWAS